MPIASEASDQPHRLGFVSVLKQAAAQDGRPGMIDTFPEDSLSDTQFDNMTPPLSQSRWFQTSAKAVRMSVLEHIKRSPAWKR